MHTPMNFVHLRLHTEYSLSDSTIPLKSLIKAVTDKGMASVAVTDLNNLFAVVKFYRAANGAGIKPIIGIDIYLESGEDKPFNMILLAQDHAGYLNLCRLISEGYLKGQRLGIPRVTLEWIKRYSEGVIALSGGVSGDVGKALIDGNLELASTRAMQWRDIFPNRYYLEISRTGRAGDEEQLHAAVELALKLDLPVVATNDVRFIAEEGFYSHEARTCISAGNVLDDPNRPKYYSEQQYLRSAEEMTELFADIPEALANTVEIAKRCNMELTLGKNYLPNFPVPEGMTMADFFAEESRKGLEHRLAAIFDTKAADFAQKRIAYDERLEIELGVINGMGFPGYFLIVADFIQWAKDNDIPVGPGRGSGAGSLVAYSLKITDIDPLPYDLLFERFLNPERVSMPDFDIDFCTDGRDRVIEYVAKTYGRDKVSQIITYGSMAAKAVIRDVGRVLGHGYGFVDSIAKQIPFEIGMTLTKALEQADDLKQRYDNNDEVRNLLDLALSLEGLSRNAGKHAGGVLISPSALTDFTPLYCEENGSIVSQYDKNDVEAVGLVKFDFLGLRNLTVIDWALKTINARLEKSGKPLVDITQIKLDDRAAFNLLKACRTTAVFQLESRGMKELIKRLQPDVFEDIVALVALYRPGPLGSGMVDDFVERKHGKQKVEYPHPDLAPVLEPTYGVILYQEQVMQIAQVLASFSLGAADLLRRAMGKKKPEEMEKQRSIFMEGALKNGHEAENATYIFDLMEKFSGYGFNKTVDKNTEIYTLNGIKKIKDCRAGDLVISCTVSGEYVQSKVVALHDHGNVPLWEIEFDDNTTERCTLDHKWLTEKGQQPLWKIIQLGCQVWGSSAYQARHTCSSKTVSNLYEYDNDRAISRQRAKNALWQNNQNPQEGKGTFSTVRRMSENSSRNSCGDVQEAGTYSRNASKIFRNSEENFCTSRYTATTSRALEKMARFSSRRISENSSQSTCISQAIQVGDRIGASSKKAWFYSQYTASLSNREKTSRFYQSSTENGDRGRWALALSADSIGRAFTASTSERSYAKSRDYETILEINPAFDAGLQRQIWRTYLTQSERTPEDNRRWQLGRGTVLRKPIRATFMGWHQGYDLEVDYPEHNFLLASGLCCSNSHSAAYALVSYQTAWLKAHYPAEFMAAVLSSDMDSTDKIVNFVDDCRQMKVEILPPNINLSDYRFTVDDGRIVYGLGAIKGIGEAAIELICKNRQQEGQFTSLIDLCKRMVSNKVSRRVYETLIVGGALDSLGKTRRSLMEYLPNAMRMATQYQKDQTVGQVDLFGGAAQALDGQEPEIPEREEWQERERLNKEKKALGLYLTGHPINAYGRELKQLKTHWLRDLDDLEGSTFNKVSVLIAGIVSSVRLQATDQGKRAFVQLDDGSSYLEVFIFTNTFEEYGDIIEVEELLLVEGVINTDRRTGTTRLRVTALYNMETARDVFAQRLLLKVTQSVANDATIDILQRVLQDDERRSCGVFIHYETEKATAQIRLGEAYSAPISDAELKEIEQLLGEKAVKMCY